MSGADHMLPQAMMLMMAGLAALRMMKAKTGRSYNPVRRPLMSRIARRLWSLSQRV